MKLEQSFEITASAEEIASRIVAFMERHGYRRSPVAEIVYTRGSRLGSYLSFSPRKWQVRVMISRQPLDPPRATFTLNFDINDNGQLVTQHERNYWKAELDALQRAIQGDELDGATLARQDYALISSGTKGFVSFLGVGLCVAIPTGIFIEYLPEPYSQWAVVIGVLCGITAGLLVAKRHWGF